MLCKKLLISLGEGRKGCKIILINKQKVKGIFCEKAQQGSESRKHRWRKSQSLYAFVWAPVFGCSFSPSFLKVYPSQCSAFRMHACGATMIHTITTFGDDSNHKPEVNWQIKVKGFDSRGWNLYSWKTDKAGPRSVSRVACSSGKTSWAAAP